MAITGDKIKIYLHYCSPFNNWIYMQKVFSLLLHGTPPFLICYLSRRGQLILKCKRNFKMKQNWQESSRIIKFQVTKNALAVQAPSSASHRKDAQWGKAKKIPHSFFAQKDPVLPHSFHMSGTQSVLLRMDWEVLNKWLQGWVIISWRLTKLVTLQANDSILF